MPERVDCVVIGAGVVGLACARAVALSGREVLVLERHDTIGTEISSRNSEVIHAGIYYPTNSLKARLCVAGKRALYGYCETHGVAFEACGKLIVASSDVQTATLTQIHEQASANGVTLEWLDGAAVARMEPEVSAVAGLYSPTTGIVDSHALMLSLQGDLEHAGSGVVFRAAVDRMAVHNRGVRLRCGDTELDCTWLINCAGLSAPTLAAQLLEGVPAARYARGHYYAYSGPAPFTHLIYPVPEPGGLGIHVTRDLAGQVKFGPDVTWCDAVDYAFPADEGALRRRFASAISSYYPGLDPERLYPSYTGIRPKIAGPGEPTADFSIRGPSDHGVGGFVNLMGIESPGLTCCLAIADHVVGLMHD